jgi:hypothetical protein
MAKQYIETDKYGNKFYYKDPEMTIFHRTDGPAIEYKAGSREWFVNGKHHRLDGPALEYGNDRHKMWYVNGVFMFETDREGNIIRRMR